MRLIVIVTAELDDITCMFTPSNHYALCQHAYTVLGYTSIVSWTIIEPAIEVLSVSLPVMAPFLHVKKVLAEIQTYLRPLRSLTKQSYTGSKGVFHKLNRSNNTMDGNPDDVAQRHTADGMVIEPGEIPLHSVMTT